MKTNGNLITQQIMRSSSGTMNYHRMSSLYYITDGCKTIGDIGNCYWLYDYIISYHVTDKNMMDNDLIIWRIYAMINHENETTDNIRIVSFSDVNTKDTPIGIYHDNTIYSDIKFEGEYLQLYVRDKIIFTPSEN